MPDPTSYFAHETATIDDGAEIGAGSKIWHYSHVCGGARIGRDCVFGQNAYVAPGVTVGDGVRVQNNVSLYTGVVVEDDVFLGPSCVLTNVVNPRSHVSRKDEFRATVIRRGATIGANATVVCGTEIGAYAFIGAGATVTRDVPAFAQVVGVPARQVAWRCRCGERLEAPVDADGWSARCEVCGTEYAARDGRVEVEAAPGEVRAD